MWDVESVVCHEIGPRASGRLYRAFRAECSLRADLRSLSAQKAKRLMASELLSSNDCHLIHQFSFWGGLLIGLFSLLAVHEAGHLIAARCYGIPVRRIRIGIGPVLCELSDRRGINWSIGLFPIVGCVEMGDENGVLSSAHPGALAVVYAAGPTASLLLALGICGLSLVLFGEGGLVLSVDYDTPALAASILSELSFAIGLYNILPIPPLDGGLVLLAGLRALRGIRGPPNSKSLVFRVGYVVNIVATVWLLALVAVKWLLVPGIIAG